MDKTNDVSIEADGVALRGIPPLPFFPPEGRQRCARPNFSYLDVKAQSQRNYRFGYLYDEYRQACEREGYRAIRQNTFATDFSTWRKSNARQETPEWFPAELMQTYWTRLVIHCEGGKARSLPLFAAYLPYSGLSFLRASEDQSFLSWMRCCAEAYRTFGGVPYATEFDRANDATSGTAAETRRATLQSFAAHYRTVLFRARPKARGKMAKRYGSLALRRYTAATSFVRDSIDIAPNAPVDEINRTIDTLVGAFNAASEGGAPSPRERFERGEAGKLLALPECDYDMTLWSERHVGANHHFNHDRVRYSVPYQYAGEPVRVRVRDGAIEAYSMGKIIARHEIPQSPEGKGVVTDPVHRPPQHRAFANRLEDRFMALALESGPATGAVMREIVLQCQREKGSWRACKDLLDLARTPSGIRLEDACAQVLERDMPLTAESAASIMREKTR